jgi:hypothetical protein
MVETFRAKHGIVEKPYHFGLCNRLTCRSLQLLTNGRDDIV